MKVENEIDYEKIISQCVSDAVENALKNYKRKVDGEKSRVKTQEDTDATIKNLFEMHRKTFPESRPLSMAGMGPATNDEKCCVCHQTPIYFLPCFKYAIPGGQRVCIYCFVEMMDHWYAHRGDWMDEVALDAARHYGDGTEIAPLLEPRKVYDKISIEEK